jgi:hypothetical protein
LGNAASIERLGMMAQPTTNHQEVESTCDDAGREALRRNSHYYEQLLALTNRLAATLHHGQRAEVVLDCVRMLAGFASYHHPGRFADGAVENHALAIGHSLDQLTGGIACRSEPVIARRTLDGRRRVLHVASAVRTVGGHTRTILHWVNADRESSPTLLLTGQGPFPVPAGLIEALHAAGGSLIVFPHRARLLAKSRWLRDEAHSNDLVILHHFPDDVVPTVALATEGGPPVAVLNQTDQHFWLGAAVADAVLNLRGISQDVNHRRHVRKNLLLPIPLRDPLAGANRTQARARLGIPTDELMLLSVGRAEKYCPADDQNFFRTAAAILDQNPGAQLYLLGVSAQDVEHFGITSVHPRLRLLGELEDATLYHVAADVYLEGFPFGSQTALLEALLAGVPAVPAYAPKLRLIAASVDAVMDVLKPSATEVGYVAEANRLIRDASARRGLGAELRRRVIDSHTGNGWLEQLQSAYESLATMEHKPRWLPTESCTITATDLALCAWQESRKQLGGETNRTAYLRDLVFGVAYRARQFGDYGAALRVLQQARCFWGVNRRLLTEYAKLAPHWLCRRGRANYAVADRPARLLQAS